MARKKKPYAGTTSKNVAEKPLRFGGISFTFPPLAVKQGGKGSGADDRWLVYEVHHTNEDGVAQPPHCDKVKAKDAPALKHLTQRLLNVYQVVLQPMCGDTPLGPPCIVKHQPTTYLLDLHAELSCMPGSGADIVRTRIRSIRHGKRRSVARVVGAEEVGFQQFEYKNPVNAAVERVDVTLVTGAGDTLSATRTYTTGTLVFKAIDFGQQPYDVMQVTFQPFDKDDLEVGTPGQQGGVQFFVCAVGETLVDGNIVTSWWACDEAPCDDCPDGT